MENKKLEYYTKSAEETLKIFESKEDGLSQKEAQKRLEKYGKNELKEAPKKSLARRFLDQLSDTMILVLIAAAFVSAGVNIWEGNYMELFESGLILLIVIINAIIGLTQESKAAEALEALKNMNKPEVKVKRDGKIIKIKAADLVPGDIVELEAGDIVPADLRLVSANSIKIEEAALTGESLPVSKNSDLVLADKTPLGDRRNMAFSSSIVSYGRGEGVVVETGMNTEVGKIAGMLSETEDAKTPLQLQLAKTAKYLSYLVLFIAVIIFIASFINIPSGESITDNVINSFMTAVAIAVAAIPEGLPAVVTIVLAISVKRMSERKAIVRHLPAVETLGSCQVICSDKTGTITLNKMTIQELYTKSKGLFYLEKEDNSDKSIVKLITGMVYNNDTNIGKKGILHGDPTETALTAYAQKIGINVEKLKDLAPRVDEIPFDSKRKMMSTIHEGKDGKVAYVKGAFDLLLDKCKYILVGDEVKELTKKDKEELQNANKEMTTKALRVLGFAYKDLNPLPNLPPSQGEGENQNVASPLLTRRGLGEVGNENGEGDKNNIEKDLIFVGLVGMIDPARKEVPASIETCKKAGIEVVMITGDHLETAVAIAKQVGIFEEGNIAMTGAELDSLSEKEFLKKLKDIRVFARVSPENKVRIVKAFKSKKMIVAMTGDGVNDAPSIKIADIGVGMGITGTDVSKGAADIVLADDNFATIVNAVEEGRKAYSNIQKAVQYLLSANIAEVLCLFIATIFLKVPFLTPVMILWINLVTDSLPALALGTEKAEDDIMEKPPRKSGKSLFAGQTGKDIIIQGIMQTILVMTSFMLGKYVLVSGIEHPLEATTMAFITLCFIQLFHAYNLRSQDKSIFHTNPFTNKYLNLSFLVGTALVALVVLVPGIRDFFSAVPITPLEYAISIGCSILIIPMVEVQKLIERSLVKGKVN